MTRIGIISDTHGFFDPLIPQYFADRDEIWHAGDIGDLTVIKQLQTIAPVRAVYGNIDGSEARKQYREHLHFQCETFKVYITHIGGYPGKYSPQARQEIIQHQPDLFICGHSHILKVMRDAIFNQMLCINPGAAGREGFHVFKTILLLNLDEGKISDVKAVELGKRGK